MWELDHKEEAVPINWCIPTVVLENSWESLEQKEIKQVNPKGNHSWIFIGRTDVEAEASILWSPDGNSQLIFISLFIFNFIYLFIYSCFISWRLITLQYCSGFCHTLTRISHSFTCIPHPDPPSHLPLHPIPLGLPSAPGLSTCLLHPTWAGDLFHPR